MPETTSASFILRLTQEHTSGVKPSGGAWRGVIRHVQSHEQIRFTRMEDALDFIAQYVDITGSGAVTEEEDA